MKGVVGGAEAGYNRQLGPKLTLGIETDFSGSGLRGTGGGSPVLVTNPISITQALAVQQKLDWYGSVRGRVGFLPTEKLMLFGTGGLAYGRVQSDGVLSAYGPSGTIYQMVSGQTSFACPVNGSACFAGSSSQTRVGYTIGGGAERLFWRNWSVKLEYQYVNLDVAPLRMSATGTAAGSPIPASLNANFVRDDFQVVRAAVNYHF